MSDSRVPGRYRLDRLGWTAFEDLCLQILRVVLGETCTRFGPGSDAGRDGYYRGVASGKLASQDQLEGAFVIQCKHSSRPEAALQPSDLEPEATKLAKLAAQESCHYLLMTNRRVSAPAEAKIRETFEAIPGVGRVLIFGGSWIEDTIDAEPRLLRLVPRLYGIGDLSQIVSFTLEQQTRALFEELAHSLRTYVPTESYRQAERALADHGFVVLVGPPAAGKSAIAANLCLVLMAQDSDLRVLRIERAEEFKHTWSPADRNTLYWVDDVFGETTLDVENLKEWSAALDKVEAARRCGGRILFCTRDYILEAARRKMKPSKADLIYDARVRVDVTALSEAEKASILYNHIKAGDLTREQKKLLKSSLPDLARRDTFSPELARRLGSARFHRGLSYDLKSLRDFFDRPLAYLRELLHGLSESESAALVVCLLNGNAVPDPVPDEAISSVVLDSFDASRQKIRDAFEMLEGSLVKRSRHSARQIWQLHHPLMIEAMQEEYARRPSRIVLYLEGTELMTLLRDTTTLEPPENSRLVFVPDTVYKILVKRLESTDRDSSESIASYLVERSSDSFVAVIDALNPEILDRALALVPSPEVTSWAPELAVHLKRVGLLGERRKGIVAKALRESLEECGWLSFLEVRGFSSALPGFTEEILRTQAVAGFPCIEALNEWLSADLSSAGHVEVAIEAANTQQDNLRAGLVAAGYPEALVQGAVDAAQSHIDRLHERWESEEAEEFLRAEMRSDESFADEDWRDSQWQYQRHEDRFADVDE